MDLAVALLKIEEFSPDAKRVYATLNQAELAANLDLEDPSGRLSSAALLAACETMRSLWRFTLDPPRDEWTPADVCALAEIVLDALKHGPDHDSEQILRSGRWQLGPFVDGELAIEYAALNSSEQAPRTGVAHLSQFVHELEPELELAPLDRRRRVIRLLLKATGHADRVVPDEQGGWRIAEAPVNGRPPSDR